MVVTVDEDGGDGVDGVGGGIKTEWSGVSGGADCEVVSDDDGFKTRSSDDRTFDSLALIPNKGKSIRCSLS